MLGLVPTPRPRWSEVLADFFELTRDRLKGKAADQVKRWEDPRKLAVDNMVGVFGDKRINKSTASMRSPSANGGKIGSRRAQPQHGKQAIRARLGIFETVNGLRHYGLTNPFTRAAVARGRGGADTREPIPAEFIRDANSLSARSTGSTRGPRYPASMVNTGAGPDEIIGLEARGTRLDHEIPHIQIPPNGMRGPENHHGDRAREIPALGVSLAALRRLQAAGGCSRYAKRIDGWSTAVDKYMRETAYAKTIASPLFATAFVRGPLTRKRLR